MIDLDTLMEVIRGRRSVRMFKREPVPREMIERIVDAAGWAPSAGNRQDWEFTVVYADPVKRELGKLTRAAWDAMLARPDAESVAEELKRHSRYFSWFSRVPVVIAVSAHEADGYMAYLCGADAADIAGHKTSGAMAAQNLLLAAHALGLGTCCLTAPLAAKEEIKTLLGLGRRRDLVCLIALGWPSGESPIMPRKAVDQIMKVVE